LRAGRPEEAEREFGAALAERPENQAALVGQALATSQFAPESAEPLWRRVFDGFDGPHRPEWQVIRARALADAGDPDQAYVLLRRVFEETENADPLAYFLLAHLLIETGRRQEAALELAQGHLREGGGATDFHRLRVQEWLGDAPAARASFTGALRSARSEVELSALLPMLVGAFGHFEREEMWRAMRARAEELSPRKEPDVICLLLRLDLALWDYETFLSRFSTAPPLPKPWGARFRRVAEVLTAPQFPDLAAPKVFAIGLTRTGTTSLGQALEQLGFLQAHFHSPFSFQILTDDDFAFFDAATDTPVSMRFEMLYGMFPNARFILTERPYDSWIVSMEDYFRKRYGTCDLSALRGLQTRNGAAPNDADAALVHGALYFAHPSLRDAFDAHVRRVESFFADKPAHKLLRHNVFAGDGWRELCHFLGVAAPEEPYPVSNQSMKVLRA
jgi:tetratricopeptide (TPR) repeat protein